MSLRLFFYRFIGKLVILLAVVISSLPVLLHAQSVTNIDISSTVVQAGVQRLGMNIGAHNFYDSGQFTKNLVFRNPGFEPQIFQSAIRCLIGTANTCTDDDLWSGWTANFWKGATYEVIYGKAIGRKGTIVSSTVPINNVLGSVLTFDNNGTPPGIGDYLVLRKAIPGNGTVGWSPSTTGAATITNETKDLPPGTAGVQAVRVTAPSANDTASVASYFDTTAGLTFVQLNGHFQLSFKAKGAGGGNTVQVYVYRTGGSNFISQTLNLTTSWNTYNLAFPATENGKVIGAMNIVFTGQGPTAFLLDEVSLMQTDGSTSNPTAYRDAVVSTLKTLAPGSIRYWDYQLGESLDNWIAPPFARKAAGYSAWNTEPTDISIGLHEFLQLCQNVGAEPWVIVPVVFSTTEASNLIEYLSGTSTSTYGAKRAARGQAAPWTSVFSKIHLELGNETWNSDFRGGNMEYADAYGAFSNTIFGAMRANSNYVSSKYDLIVGGQEAFLGRNQTILSYAHEYDTFSVAGYISSGVDSYANNEQLYGPLFAQPEADNAPGGLFAQNRPLSTNLAAYELNMGTVNGAIPQATLNSFVPSLGAGLAIADHMLMMMRDLGVHPINFWQLGQYDFLRPDGKTVPLFGAVIDMGVTNRRRPQFQAAALANQVIGGDMVKAVQGGTGPNANPTWNQPLVNDVQFSAAHYIQSYAFSKGTSRSVILFNLHRTNPLQVTFSNVNAPTGTVQMQRLQATNLTDTNEISQKVNVVSQQLTGFKPSTAYTLPPYTMTVLTWTAPSSPSVSISLSPSSVTLGNGGKQQFTATVSGSSNTAVTWGISPSVGSISSSGLYTAPASLSTQQTVLVTATSKADSSKTDTSAITLIPPVSVSVTPNQATIAPGQTTQFVSKVLNTSNIAVKWSLSPAIGTINSAGVYTAPSLVVVPINLKVTAASVASPSQTGASTIALTPGGSGPFAPFAVNCGGNAVTDSSGLTWLADVGYTGVSTSSTTSNIAGTTNQSLYRDQRWGALSYAFTVPNGTYQVTLKFAELYYTKPGQRVFDVVLNGQKVLPAFDMVKAAGATLTAVDRNVTATVTNGKLSLTFNNITDYPALNGLEIVQLGTPVTVSPASATLTGGATAQFHAAGGNGSSYAWTLSPNVGTVSASGLYTAPSSITTAQTVTLSVKNSTNGTNTAVASIQLQTTAPAGYTIAIDAGGTYYYQDSSGQGWSADAAFTGGLTQTVTNPIAGTSAPLLYQSNRWGHFSYGGPLSNGTYKVTLKFAEIFWTKPGQRIFNVLFNGQPVLTNFDIIAAAGAPFTAVDRSFNVNITTGYLTLDFTQVADNPLVSAFKIVKQ